MKTLTPGMKRQITSDWLQHFPGLGAYKPLHLLRRVGPILEGIALERNSANNSYRPTFHVHCLARECPAVTLSLPHRLRNARNGAIESIPVLHHAVKYDEACARLSAQAPLNLVGDLRIADLIKAYREYLDRPGTHYDASLLCEDMACIYGWRGEVGLASAIVIEVAESMAQWPQGVLEALGDVKVWRDRLLEVTADRDRLRATADAQAKALEAENLPQSGLLL